MRSDSSNHPFSFISDRAKRGFRKHASAQHANGHNQRQYRFSSGFRVQLFWHLTTSLAYFNTAPKKRFDLSYAIGYDGIYFFIVCIDLQGGIEQKTSLVILVGLRSRHGVIEKGGDGIFGSSKASSLTSMS